MRTSVQKWGNSLGIRIPKVVADEMSLRSGSSIEVVREDDAIVVRPIRKARLGYRLSDLTRRITSKNRHAEVAVDRTRGREAW